MKVVIIGGVAAGTKAAAVLRRQNAECEIHIYTDDTHVSYSSCGLPYFIEGNFDDIDYLIARTPEQFAESNIQVHLLNKAIKIMPETKEIVVRNLTTNSLENVSYDTLVIATGASPIIPYIQNTKLNNIFTLRKMEDGLRIKEKMLKSKTAVIVGGGYIGIELLEAFAKNNLKTTLVEFQPTIMTIFDDDFSKMIKEYILHTGPNNIKIINNDFVTEFVGKTDVEKVKTKNGLEISPDFVVLAAGVSPNVDIAREAGIHLGSTGAIKVNNKMQTNIADIYACGDCVEKINIVSNQPVWVPLGSTANKEGRCAAFNISGQENLFEGILGSSVTRYFNLTIAKTGLTENEAHLAEFTPVSVTITQKDKPGYMPDVKNIILKLTADKYTRMLLGIQGLGYGDVDKRVNTLTGALMSKMTVDNFFEDDITYAPPYSQSIDPILTAAKKLINVLNKA